MTDDDQLREAIGREAAEGKVSCHAMLALAERLEVSPKKIGELCNEMNIKIAACQLGCFR